MAEQLEIVIGANVDDAKAGIQSITDVINDFARQGKLSIGTVEQSLIQLRQTIKTTSDPADIAKLKTAYDELSKTLVGLKNDAGLEQRLGGISRATRLAHSDVDQLSRSIALFSQGNERGVDTISNLLFTFERLEGVTGGARQALASLVATFSGPAGIAIALSTAVNLLGPFVEKLFEASDAEKKAAEQTKELKKQLDSLKSVSDITITATGGVQGEIEKVLALAQAVQDTNISYKERIQALNELQAANKNYFGDITLETESLEKLTARVNEYTNALIQAAVVKGFENEISKVAPELGKLNKAFNDANDNINKLKKNLDDLNAAPKIPQPQVLLPGGIAGVTTQQLSDQTAAQLKLIQAIQDEITKRDALAGTLQKERSNYADLQDAIHLAVNESLKFKPLDTKQVDKGLDETAKKIIDLAKLASTIFNIPVPLRFAIDDSSKQEFKKAQDILKGIEDHTIRVRVVVPSIEFPSLLPRIDESGFKKEFDGLVNGLTIPLKLLLDEPSLLETEDQVKKIFSGFSDTNIFTEFGRNAGTKFREALLESVKIFDKGFVINPQIDVSDVIASLTASLAGIKDIQLKVIRTETFDQAIRTLRDLHDAGVEAGNAVEKAFLDAGKSSADAVKAGKAVENAFGGITKQVADVADAVNTTLTSAFQDFFKAVETGKNPIKAFFEAIISSVEQVASKLIGSAIEKALLSLITTTTAVTTAVSASATAVAGAAAASVGAAGTAAAAAAGATTAAAAASAAAVAAIAAAAAAKIALASVNPLSLLGLIGLGFAEGGRPPVGEWVIVGERGPELAKFDQPARIFSNSESKSILSSSSVKEHESIKEYLIAEKVSQQIKEHFTAAFKSVESSIKVLVTNNEKLATYSYHLHEVVSGLKESFSSISKESLSKELVVNNTDSKSFDKINSSIKEAINVINNATVVNNSASYENLIERFKTSMSNDKSITSNSDTKQLTYTIDKLHERISLSNSQINSLIERSSTIDKSVTIERIINNNFYTSKTSESLKQMSLHDLQHTFHIPAFAGGGAVFGPTLAILGEGFGISRSNPEFVGTANQLRGIQGGAFDVNVNVGGELSFSMGKLAIALNREVRSQLRTSGKPPF